MSTLTEKQIQRIARQAVGGGSGGFSPSLLAGYATEEWVGENYLSIEWFNSLFNAVDSNGDPILPNDGNTSNIDSIKAMFGFWTEQYISALGQGNDGGGGGAGDVTWALLADNNDTRPIALSHLTTALATYATQSWVQSQGYATLAQLNALEYLATITQGDGYVTLTSNKNTNYIVDLTHEHSWFEIQDRPTTLADYGVKDELDTILSGYLATSAWRSLTFYGDGNTIGTYIPTAAMTVDFVSGTNISISRDATNHKLTINNTYQHPTGGADTTILSQDGRVLSSISVNAFGHVTSVGYKTLSMADMPAAMKYYNTITTTADGSLTFIGYNTPDAVVDLTHQHSWFEIQDRPTSLAEFGISADDPLLKDNYLTIEFFSALFKAYAGTTEVRPNGSTSTVDNIKAMFGFWTAQYLSALGLGADGQAGTFDESQMWQALGTDSSSKQISAAYLTNATRYNAITIADGGITFSGVGVPNTTVDLTHDHCFGELKATPDSLAGYGIIDAYILGTKIYLGNQSIDVSGGQVDLSGYATQSWVQTYYQPVGNYLTSASLDGFVSRSGSAMYTDAVISRTGSSVMWVQGRSYPIIKTLSYTGYNAILSMKTTNGSWDLGVYSDNTAYMTYITDADYNNINNNVTYQLTFPKDSGTIALTKNIPTSLPASDVYSWAKQPSKPSYSWSEISSKPNVAIQEEHNNLTASGNEFTTAASGQSGSYYWNYRTAGGLNGSITEYIFCNGNTGKAQLNAASITANGYLYSVSNGITVQIGAQNSSWAHITNSGGLSFWFGNPICTQGAVYPYVSDAYTLGTSSYYWSTAYIKNINIGSNLYYGTSFGINMNNSDIIGCNSIRTLDLSDDYTEALMFARTNGNWDSFRASDGNFYFHVNNGTTVSMLNADGLYVYNGWLRTTGATGWYSETYGGGWYMEDATWIRSYNGKYVWVDSYLCSQHISAGTSSINSSYALYVSGVGYFSSGVYSAGYVTALSDIRKKNVLSYNLDIDIYNIANAPAIKFTWIDGDSTEQVGTIAQYWKNILPQVVVEENDIARTLSMDYGVTALVSVIATARKVVDHEARIRKLEQENEELRKQISQLKAA